MGLILRSGTPVGMLLNIITPAGMILILFDPSLAVGIIFILLYTNRYRFGVENMQVGMLFASLKYIGG